MPLGILIAAGIMLAVVLLALRREHAKPLPQPVPDSRMILDELMRRAAKVG